MIDVIIKRIGGLIMLTTPLGDIEIYIDDKKIAIWIVSPNGLCKNLFNSIVKNCLYSG